jgi:hypothetical protein
MIEKEISRSGREKGDSDESTSQNKHTEGGREGGMEMGREGEL